MRTWHKEALVVGLVLAGTLIFSGRKPIEWVGSAAVFLTFLHAQIAFRLDEAAARVEGPHEVECRYKLVWYFLGKEALWFAYFTWLGAWSALVGVATFLAYPSWRRYHLGKRGRL